MKLVRLLKTALAVLLCSSMAMAQLSADDVKTFTLDNGMKFLVLENHNIPNISFYIFWKVGSRNEVPGITGISHFFEHMMFNGAKKYGRGDFDRVMEAGGGSNNAYTTENMTVYTNWVPTDFLETMFDLEADRIANLSFDDKVIESERGVIASERITGLENSNYRLLEEQVKLTAMQAHPYRWSVIGYESDIKNWSKQDLINYHRTYYAPNNGVAVIVGDVKVDEVKRLAEKYIEPIPAQDPPRKVHTVEPEQLGEKRLEVDKKVSTPNILIAYHVPATNSPEFLALSLLDSILSEGRTSRLYKSLVDEKRLAVTVNTGLDYNFDPGLYYIYAICAAGVDVADLEAEIHAQIEDVVKNGVTERELQKAKNQWRMSFYRSMTTNSGRANTIGTFEMFFGDYKKLFTAVDDFDKVTLDDIKAVAAKYLKKKNRTVGILRDLEGEGE